MRLSTFENYNTRYYSFIYSLLLYDSESDSESLAEDLLYGGDDLADDLGGGDDLAVLAGAGARDPATTGPGPATKTDRSSVLTSAGLGSLTRATGRETKLTGRVLGHLGWLEGPATGTGAEVWHGLGSSARVPVVVDGELELLAVRAAAGRGGLAFTGVQSVCEDPLLQEGVLSDGLPDVVQEPASSPNIQATGPVICDTTHHSSKDLKQLLRFAVAADQQT